MSAILEAALHYANCGVPVFPCSPKNKAPLVSGSFHKATIDPGQIKKWWTENPTAMIGMPTGLASGIDVLDLDVDPTKSKNGLAEVPDWQERSPIIVQTPRGGRHLWYKSDDTIRCTTDIIAHGVDTRGVGGYVILPPSQNGAAAYRFEQGSEQQLATLPPFPADLRARLQIDYGPRTPGDEPEADQELVAAALVVIPNDDLGWEEWNKIGMAVWRATGGSYAGLTAFDLFSQKSPKYNAAETQRRWDHYFKSSPTKIGAGTLFFMAGQASPEWRDDYDAQNEEAVAAANRKASYSNYRRTADGENESRNHTKSNEAPKTDELLQSSAKFAADFVPPDYQIDGLLQRRFIYSLTGPTGSGKTCIALRIAAHSALGLRLDDRDVEKNRVLFFAGENPDDVRMRWIKLCEEMEQEPSGMDVYFLPGAPAIADAQIRKMIDAEAKKHGPFGLLIIDTSAAYFRGDDENSNAQLGAHARTLRSFVNLPGGPSIIVTAHPTKSPNMDNLLPRGGGAFIAEMDGNLVCMKNDPVVNLHWHGKFRGPDFAPIPFKLNPGTSEKLKDAKGRHIWTVTATPISEAEKAGIEGTGRTRQDQLLVLLSGEPHLTLDAMTERLGWKTKNDKPNRPLVNRTLNSLIVDKLVVRKRGQIVLTPEGQKAANASGIM